MRNKARLLIAALALLGAVAALAAPVQGSCTVHAGVQWVGVGLIDHPFAYQDLRPALTPAEIQNLPPLPDPDDKTVRREHVYISTTLANLIGLHPHYPSGTDGVDPDWRKPNPQIRIWIEDPSSFSNFYQKDAQGNLVYRDRASSAIFTVVGVIESHLQRVWVYEQKSSTDVHSGEYKLFASDTATSGGSRIARAQQFVDLDGNGELDGVWARVLVTPVSSSKQTRNGQTTTQSFYCEPDTWKDANGKDKTLGSLTEVAVNADDDRFALLVPHGGAIETDVSAQIAPFRQVLEAAPYGVPVSYWEVQGKWGDNQTSRRWHATSTNLSGTGFPGLRMMLDQPRYDDDAGKAFRYALSLHGFSEDGLELIIGGAASRDDKCVVAQRIQDQLEDAGRSRRVIAMVIRDAAEDDLDIEDDNGDTVGTDDHKGLSAANIVNRLAADGGIQLEQSKGLRDDSVLRDAVARGAARAMGELLTDTELTDPCEPYLPEEPSAGREPEAACFQFHYPPAPETFVIQLTDGAAIEHARRILDRDEEPKQHVLGKVVPKAEPYNRIWSYHLEPGSIQFFEYAVEVCDAGIQFVEDHLDEVGGAFLPGGVWCPWGSMLTEEVSCDL